MADRARLEVARGRRSPQSGAGSTIEHLERAVAVGKKATTTGVVISALLAAIKIGAGWLGNSFALIADGVESVLDIFSSLLVLGGLRLSATPQTPEYPYGRGKAEPLAALVVATVLLAAAVGIAVGAVYEIVTPQRSPAPFTLVVLVAVVLGKELTYRLLLRKGEQVGSQALRTDAWHHRSDALTSLAAFVGISIALAMGEGYESADDWAALLACGVIAFNGARLFVGALREVLDVSAPEEIKQQIRTMATAVDGVTGIDVLRVRRSGLVLLVDIHVEVDHRISVLAGHEIAHRVKDRLLASDLPILDVLVHIEPDVSARSDRLSQ